MPVHTYYMDVSLPYPYVVNKVAKFATSSRYVNKNVFGIFIGCISSPRISIGKYRVFCLNCARKNAEIFEKSFSWLKMKELEN